MIEKYENFKGIKINEMVDASDYLEQEQYSKDGLKEYVQSLIDIFGESESSISIDVKKGTINIKYFNSDKLSVDAMLNFFDFIAGISGELEEFYRDLTNKTFVLRFL